MSNRDNLININDRPADEQLAIRQAGGKAAAKARTRNSKLRDRLTFMMNQKSGKTTVTIDSGYMTGEHKTLETNGTYYDEMCAGLVRKAVVKGDLKAIQIVLDAMSESNEQDAE